MRIIKYLVILLCLNLAACIEGSVDFRLKAGSLISDPTLTQVTQSSTKHSTSNITYGGACESGFNVMISGSESASTSCLVGSWSWTTNQTSDGTYSYTFSQNDATGKNSSVDVTWVKDTTGPSLTLSTPANLAILKAGDSLNISWTATDLYLGDTPIKAEYSSNSGTSWTVLSSTIANTGNYSWTLPNQNSNNFVVRLSATDLAGNTTARTANISIDAAAPVVDLQNLTGGQLIRGGQTYNILWSPATDSNLATNPISLDYSTNAGITWISIASNIGNSGTYAWSVPSVTGNQYRLRVSAVDQVGHLGRSESNSNIVVDATPPTVTLTSLTGGQTIGNGAVTQITWVASDNISLLSNPIQIEISNNSGTSWTNLANGVANSGSYSWTPSSDGTQFRVRVTAKDLVGNTTIAASTSDIVVSSSAPVLTQTSISSSYLSQSDTAITYGGSCDLRPAVGGVTDVVIKLEGATVATVPCTGSAPTGTWTYLTSAFAGSGTRNYSFERSAAVTTILQATWIRDNIDPVITAVLVNDGATETVNTTVGVLVTANDALTGLSQLQIRLAAVDGLAADCSTAYANDNWRNATAASTEFLASISGNLGPKKICVWAKDQAGNISEILNPTTDSGPDRDLISLIAPQAPLITSFTLTNPANPTNPNQFEINEPALIQWTATSTAGFADNPLKLEYTIDGSTWTTIAQNTGNLTGNPTTYNSSYTAFNAPSSGFFRVRIQLKNKYGVTSNSAVSNLQNTPGWSVFAGNTSNGIGGSKASLLIKNNPSARFSRYTELPNGDLYVVSSGVGVIKIDAKTGITSMYLKHGTLNLVDNTYLSASSAVDTLRGQIISDNNGLLYVVSMSDSGNAVGRIFQINPSTGLIRFYIGGGSVIDDTATPATARVSTGRIQFDEDNTLYFLANCLDPMGSPGSQRMMKVTQVDGAAGTVSRVAGNCALSPYPEDNTNALATTLNINGNIGGFDFAVWDRGRKIYFYYRDSSANANRGIFKILDGTLYATGTPSLTVDSNSTMSINYDAATNSLMMSGSGPTRIVNMNLSGSGGDSYGSDLISNVTTGNCAEDGTLTSAACSVTNGTILRLRNGQLSYLEGGGIDGSVRIRAFGSDNRIKTIAGSQAYDNSAGTSAALRTAVGSIAYKKSTAANPGVFTEGLYFQDRLSPVWSRINPNGSVETLWGNTANQNSALTDSLPISTDLPFSAVSWSGGQFNFDSDGLPWFKLNHRLYSLDTSKNLVIRTTGSNSTTISNGVVGSSLNSIGLPTSTGYSGLSIKGTNKIFMMGGYSTLTTEPWLRIYNFNTGLLDDLMGGPSRGNTTMGPDSLAFENISNKSITSNCIDNQCRTEFVENNPSLLTDDLLYFSDGGTLRSILNPTTPGSQFLSTLFTIPGGQLIRNFTASPDGKRIFYVPAGGANRGKLMCHAILLADETSWCKNAPASHVVVGPPSVLPTIEFWPNQFTWKDNNTLLISNSNDIGEIYQLDLSKLGN